MRANTPIQEGYFDATAVFRQYHPDYHATGWKISHYTDNEEVKYNLITLNKPMIAVAGRYGFTQLPLELREHFENWIKTVTIDENKLCQPEDCDCFGFHTGACRMKGDLGI